MTLDERKYFSYYECTVHAGPSSCVPQGLPSAKQNLIERSPVWLNLSPTHLVALRPGKRRAGERVRTKEGRLEEPETRDLRSIRGKTVGRE